MKYWLERRRQEKNNGKKRISKKEIKKKVLVGKTKTREEEWKETK